MRLPFPDFLRLVPVVALVLCGLPALAQAQAPAWWAQRGVTNGGTVRDYAVVNQGQLKNIATKAYDELHDRLPASTFDAGPGLVLKNMIQGFSSGSGASNYAMANIGQVKNVAKPFYDLLIELEYTQAYPWAEASSQSDYAAANIGQVKNLFAFNITTLSDYLDSDGDLMPDQWEIISISNNGSSDVYATPIAFTASGDADQDGVSNRNEYLQGTNPFDFYNAITPNLVITEGADQCSKPGLFAPGVVTVKVINPVTGLAWPAAPVFIEVPETAGNLALQSSGAPTLSKTLTLTSDINGYVHFYYKQPEIERTSAIVGISAGMGYAEVAFNTDLASLTAKWKLNESSGSVVADQSGNNLNGTAVGTLSRTTGADGGYALSLSTTTGYPEMATSSLLGFDAADGFSVAFWVKSSASDSTMRILSKGIASGGSGYFLGMDQGSIVFGVGAANSGSAVSVATKERFNSNTWHFVTAVFDRFGRTLSISVDGTPRALKLSTTYGWTPTGTVDGRFVSFSETTELSTANTSDLLLGCRSTGVQQFKGYLEEVRLYAAPLTEGQIDALYRQDDFAPGLPSWWQLRFFSALNIDLFGDADADGLSNSDELLHGTDPSAATKVDPSGLVVWLSAQGSFTLDGNSNVRLWNNLLADLPGAQQPSVTNSRPSVTASALNSLPAVHFDGQDDYMDIYAGRKILAENCTILVVQRHTSASTAAAMLSTIDPVDGSVDPVLSWDNACKVGAFDGTSGVVATIASTPATSFGLVTLVKELHVEDLGSNVILRFRNANGTTEVSNILASSQGNGDTLRLGSTSTGSPLDVAEILIYDRVLSPDELKMAEEYLLYKYKLYVDADSDNLVDEWEQEVVDHDLFDSLNSITDILSSADYDQDGLTNTQEYQAGSDPFDYYNGILPSLMTLEGNQQMGIPGLFLEKSWSLGVYNPMTGVPMVNAPVTISVRQGGGKVALTNIGAPALYDSLDLRTDSLGRAIVYYKSPSTDGVTSEGYFVAGSGTLSFESITSYLPNRIGRWRLDSGEGTTVFDTASNANHGATVNDPVWTDDGFEKCLSFTGSSTQSVQIPNHAAYALGSGSFATVIWFKAPSSSSARTMISKEESAGPGFWVRLNSSGQVSARLTTNNSAYVSVYTSTGFADNNWHQVILAVNQQTQKAEIYVDGTARALLKNSGSSGTLQTTGISLAGITGITGDINAPFVLGIGLGGTLPYSGLLDDFSFYAQPLTTEGVAILADSDQDGLPDCWEVRYFSGLAAQSGEDTDYDGITNATELANGTNPNDYYNARQVALTFITGSSQIDRPGGILANPVEVEVRDTSNNLLVSAPVVVEVLTGTGLIQTLDDTGGQVRVAATNLRTNSQGRIVFDVYSDPETGAAGSVRITAGPATATAAVTSIQGVDYDYYEATAYTALPTFSGLTPKTHAQAANFTLSVAERTTQFALRFKGYLRIPTAGNYTLYLGSDDGSRLYLNGQLLIDHDGLHSYSEKSATVTLTPGFDLLEVQYIQATGGKSIYVGLEGPGIEKQEIPTAMLFRSADPALTDPDNDGIRSGVEAELGTNPNSADSDGDGMPDGWEVAQGTNPLTNDTTVDSDGDGLGNLSSYQFSQMQLLFLPFSEGNGIESYDALGNGRVARLEGDASWRFGYRGVGIHLSGATEDQISVANDDNLNMGSFTISMWIRPESQLGQQSTILAGKTNATDQTGYLLTTTGSGAVDFKVYRSGGSSHCQFSDTSSNTWIHIVAVCDGLNLKLYRNGTLQSTATLASAAFLSSEDMIIGSNFLGTVDEFRLHGRALTSTEIATLNQVSQTPYPQALAGDDQGVLVRDGAQLRGSLSQDLAVNEDVSYEWVKISGPGTVTFDSANEAETAVYFSMAGTYVIRLTATSPSFTSSDDVQIVVTDSDSDGDGVLDGQEIANGTDPDDFFNGVIPNIVVVSGDLQTGQPDQFLALPLQILVSHPDTGNPWTGAPVDFTVSDGTGSLATTSVGSPTLVSELRMTTDSLGKVQVAFKQPAEAGVESEVSAMAGLAGTSFRSRTSILQPPVGYWKFDESSGTTATDTAATAGNGQLRNSATRTAGAFATAVTLNGTSQDVLVPDDTDLQFGSNSFAVSLWFKRGSTSTGGCLIDKTTVNGSGQAKGYRISVSASGNLTFLLGEEGTSAILTFKTTTAFADTKWHQAVLTVNQTSKALKVYVDSIPRDLELLSGSSGTAAGTKVSFSSVSGLAVTSTAGMTFGSRQGTDTFLNGAMDDVRFYAQALQAKGVWELADSDFDGLPDAWEIQNFGDLDETAQGDPDGDGFNNFEEWQNDVDPNDATNGGKVVPKLTLVSGGGQQAAAGECLPDPLVFRARDSGGTLLSNINIIFRASAGYGMVFGADGIEREQVTITTDTQGLCELLVKATCPQ